MNETYVEWMVKKKTPAYMKLLKILCIMLAVCFIFLGMLYTVAMIIGLVLAVVAYFVSINCDIEYEYLYVDKELSVDKIMAKSRRKKVATFDMGKMEVLAPIKSHALDNYQHRKDKVTDYSCGEEKQPDNRWVFFYDGQQKVIFEPNEEIIKAIQMIAPRKVFKY